LFIGTQFSILYRSKHRREWVRVGRGEFLRFTFFLNDLSVKGKRKTTEIDVEEKE